MITWTIPEGNIIYRVVSLKIKQEISNYTSRYLLKEYKNTNLKGYKHPDIYSNIINHSQIMERAQMSINIYIHTLEYYYSGGIVLLLEYICVYTHTHTHTHTLQY